MRHLAPVLLLLLPVLACRDPTCVAKLRARPGSDTAAALRVAVDTVVRRWAASPKDARRAVALSVRRAGPDTIIVEVGPRCGRGRDFTTATVRLRAPDRVLDVEEHIGG